MIDAHVHPLLRVPTIYFPRELERGFKRRARVAFPLEHIEAIAGDFDAWSGGVRIKALLDMAHTRHKDGRGLTMLDADDNDHNEVEFVKKWAEELGHRWLGTIHTHPGNDTCHEMSLTDHRQGWAEGELVSGILHLYRVGNPPVGLKPDRRRWNSRLAWWIPQPEILTVYT
jgi:hypothetical protein